MDWQKLGRDMGVLLGGSEHDHKLEPPSEANVYQHRERRDGERLGVRIYEASEARMRRRQL